MCRGPKTDLCNFRSDESVGVIKIAWIGPSTHDWRTISALSALGSYLSSGSASPLWQEYVENKDSSCSSRF